jgi:hypothetical protein
MKYLAAIALTLSAAALTQARHDVLSLNNGNDSQCQDYVIGDIATGAEIAAMLREAANGAERYGCVNIIVEHGA